MGGRFEQHVTALARAANVAIASMQNVLGEITALSGEGATRSTSDATRFPTAQGE